MVYFTLEVLTEGLNMYQKALTTYDRRSQLIIITGSVVLLASRFHSCSKIEPVNKIISPDHVIVTEPFCYARKYMYIHANPTDLRGSLPNFQVFYRLPILDVFLPI